MLHVRRAWRGLVAVVAVLLLSKLAVAEEANYRRDPDDGPLAITSAFADQDQELLTILGSNLCHRLAPRVTLGDVPLAVSSFSSTEILAILPAKLPPGSYRLVVSRSRGSQSGAFEVAVGAMGPAGPEGPRGPEGLEGPAGLPGPQGATGATGSAGPGGPAGVQGPQGASFTWRGEFECSASYAPRDVISYQGSAWIANAAIGGCVQPPLRPWELLAAKGADGATGAQGPQGPAGTNGTNGAQGPQGNTGAQGPPGPTGPSAGSDVMWAVIAADASFIAKSANFSAPSVTKSGSFYFMDFARDVRQCATIATASDFYIALAQTTTARFNPAVSHRVFVSLFHGYDILGAPMAVNGEFSLTVYCNP